MTARDEGPILGPTWIHFGSAAILFAGLAFGFANMDRDTRLGVAIIALSAIPAAITAFQLVRLFRALGRATLEMHDAIVPMGWSGTATYVRPLRGATVRSIEGRLQCEEKVIRGSGKHRKIFREIVADEPLTPMAAPALEELRAQIPIRIPAAGPATLIYTDNEVTWFVRLQLRMDGCPDTRSSFRIRIAPAVKA